MGLCFIVEDVILKETKATADNNASNSNNNTNTYIHSKAGPFTGQIISAMKEACKEAFLSRSVRLVEAMYLCDIQVPQEFMGKVYQVLGRRRAKIKREEVKDTSVFSIEALLPGKQLFIDIIRI